MEIIDKANDPTLKQEIWQVIQTSINGLYNQEPEIIFQVIRTGKDQETIGSRNIPAKELLSLRKNAMIEKHQRCFVCKAWKKYYELGGWAYNKKTKKLWREIMWYGKELTVHHKHYRTVGNEAEEDLMVVCNECHSKIHNEAKI